MDALEAWYAALRSPPGMKFAVEDIERARAKLYLVRKEANDPQLSVLMVTTSPTNPNHLWIVHAKEAPRPTQSSIEDIEI